MQASINTASLATTNEITGKLQNTTAESVEELRIAAYHGRRDHILQSGITEKPWVSLSNGPEKYQKGFEPLLPACDLVEYGNTAELEKKLKSGDVAAFIVEPIQGEEV